MKGKRVARTAAKKQTAAKGSVKKATCMGCGKDVTEETRAVQCDRCVGGDAWKCIECLKMSTEGYDILMSESGENFKWFCDKCNGEIMTAGIPWTDCGSKLDAMVSLLEQLLERTASMEQKLGEKADQKAVSELEIRVQKLEQRMYLPRRGRTQCRQWRKS